MKETIQFIHKGNGVYEGTIVDNLLAINTGDSVNEALAYGYGMTASSVTKIAEMQTLAYQVPKTPTPLKMTRLTTYENWTILLRDNKLVAVNEKGETIEAIGSLLSAGGKAWMWKGGQLWSGVLERTLTEKQEQDIVKDEKVNAVMKKYRAKIDKLEDKQEALQRKRDEELRSL